MSLAQASRLLGRALQQGAQQQAAHSRAPTAARAQARRAFGGHSHGDPSEYVTYAGLSLKKASFGEYAASKAIGGFMWFWVFKMMYDNWEHKMYGLPYIFEKEGLDDDDDDGHGHGHH